MSRSAASHFELLYKEQGGKCYYCGVRLSYRYPLYPGERATMDHIYPRSRGGDHKLDNKVLACQPCNNIKADKVYKPAPIKSTKVRSSDE